MQQKQPVYDKRLQRIVKKIKHDNFFERVFGAARYAIPIPG